MQMEMVTLADADLYGVGARLDQGPRALGRGDIADDHLRVVC